MQQSETRSNKKWMDRQNHNGDISITSKCHKIVTRIFGFSYSGSIWIDLLLVSRPLLSLSLSLFQNWKLWEKHTHAWIRIEFRSCSSTLYHSSSYSISSSLSHDDDWGGYIYRVKARVQFLGSSFTHFP